MNKYEEKGDCVGKDVEEKEEDDGMCHAAASASIAETLMGPIQSSFALSYGVLNEKVSK